MRRHTVLLGAVLLVLAALLGGWMRPWQLVKPNIGGAPTPTVAIGAAAPAFALPALGRAEPMSLDGARGRTVVLNFWATWCKYCVHEMPLLESIHKSQRSVAVLGVDDTVAENSVGDVGKYAKKLGVTYPVLLDLSGSVVSEYQVHSYPTTYFIDPSGQITGEVVGELNAGLLSAELKRASVPGKRAA